MPIAFIFFFFGEFIVMVLFQRGNFSSFDSMITSNTLKIYSISLVFYAIYSVLNKFLFSTSLLKELLSLISVGLLIKITLNILFVETLFQNGLALSTSISFIFYCMISLIIIKKIKIHAFLNFSQNLFFYIVNSTICIVLVLLIHNNLLSEGNVYLTNTAEIIFFMFFFLFNSYLVRDNSFILVINSLKEIKQTYLKKNH